jgi:hypothetical protein
MPKTTSVLTLTLLTLATMAFAQEQRDLTWGTSKAPCMAGRKVTPALSHLGTIAPATGRLPGESDDVNSDAISGSSLVFPNSQYAAGGAGLRNRTRAHIQITGLPGPKVPMSATAAVMYWAIITEGPAPKQYYTVRLTNMQSKLTASLTGTVIGTGPSPCWPGDTITVFRVLVPTGSFGPLGNMSTGDYEVNVSTGAANTYGDPWIAPSAPEWEGVSLILIAPGNPGDPFHNATVAIYDTGIAGNTFGGGPPPGFGDIEEYTLLLPPNTAGSGTFTNIGADGQVGVSTSAAFPQVVGERTFINFKQVAGRPGGSPPDSLDTDSDWNGTIAGPLPQLWDTTTHTIGPFGSSPTMDVSFTSVTSDCVTQVANVVLIF